MNANRILFLVVSLIGLALPNHCLAQGRAALAREAAEYVLSKFSKEAAEIGLETLTRKIERLALKHGDDVFVAVRKVGPRTLRLVEEAGEHGLASVKLMARYGDDAVWVVRNKNRLAIFARYGDNAAESMIKHGEIAEPLIQSFGNPAANALKAVNSQNARRLAMMAEDGHLARIGRTPELLEVIAKYGDRASDFIWRNKGALTVASTLTAFLANPEPFINGTADITRIVSENTLKPLANLPGQFVSEAAKNTNWTAVLATGVGLLGLLAGARLFLRHRRSTGEVSSTTQTR